MVDAALMKSEDIDCVQERIWLARYHEGRQTQEWERRGGAMETGLAGSVADLI